MQAILCLAGVARWWDRVGGILLPDFGMTGDDSLVSMTTIFLKFDNVLCSVIVHSLLTGYR